MAPTTRAEPPPARLLDITRLVSRAGRVLTGVDRVERAYLAALPGAGPFFALLRTPPGYLLLDCDGAARMLELVDGALPGRPGWLSRLGRARRPEVQALESRARELAIARCLRGGLGPMLRRHLPPGTAYLNTGISNLTDTVLRGVRAVPGATVAVFVHDTIPLDHPDLVRPAALPRARAYLDRCARADRILTSAEATAARIRHHLGPAVPPVTVAPLGVEVPAPGTLEPPTTGPWFVAVGTLEPRKNIGLLLDVWERFGPDPPTLCLVGQRGWESDAFFARLDAGIPGVREVPGADDASRSALVSGARALLFPSLAEGYGLPPLEAAALGVPVVCGDLAICREVLGPVGIYLPTGDSYAWEKTIRQLTEQPDRQPQSPTSPPRWADHFKIVLSVT